MRQNPTHLLRPPDTRPPRRKQHHEQHEVRVKVQRRCKHPSVNQAHPVCTSTARTLSREAVHTPRGVQKTTRCMHRPRLSQHHEQRALRVEMQRRCKHPSVNQAHPVCTSTAHTLSREAVRTPHGVQKTTRCSHRVRTQAELQTLPRGGPRNTPGTLAPAPTVRAKHLFSAQLCRRATLA